jgi:hypothetical protein
MPIISGYISAPKNCEIPRQSWLSWISLGGNIRSKTRSATTGKLADAWRRSNSTAQLFFRTAT